MDSSDKLNETAFRKAAELLGDDPDLSTDESLDDDNAQDDARIGRYRIISRLGQGGMGIVYEAEQTSPFRRVALKVIRHGPAVDEQQVRLFQREADTLARLKHPNIAAIYEAGRTEQNQHFFAMELVKGVPLTDYVNGKRVNGKRVNGKRINGTAEPSGRNQCLRLFRQICDAIHYAHQKGVIHRDLKPSNILVTDDYDSDSSSASGSRGTSFKGPMIKILDFGLARITDGDLRATTIITEVGRVQGTLPYMSPEQARGNPDDIDVRTDVYALGVILYELLTGDLPYRVNRNMLTEAVRVICEEQPKKPSTSDRTLRGDLETIALKALEKDPERRYVSAAALAEDIECFLTNQPIHARPPSAIYQLGKLFTRHKGAFAAALAFIVVLSAATVVSINQARLAEREAMRAEGETMRAQDLARLANVEANKAEEVTRFLTSMLSNAANEEKGPDLTVREVLDVAADQMNKEDAKDPEVEATIRSAIAETYRKMGMYRQALDHMKIALNLNIKLKGDDNEKVALEYNNIAGLHFLLNDHAGAEKYLAKALDINEKIHGPGHPNVIRFRSNLGSLYASLGRREDAETMFREIINTPANNDMMTRAKDSAALNLAKLLRGRGQYQEAESILEQLITGLNERFGLEHARTLKAVLMLADLQNKTGRTQEAAQTMARSIAIRRKVLGDDHPELAESLFSYGALVRQLGQYNQALDLTREALEIRRKVYGQSHTVTISTVAQLAAIKRDLGEYDESAEIFEQLLEQLDQHNPTQANEYTSMLTELGKIRYRQGRNDLSVIPLRKAYRRLLSSGLDETPEARETISVLGIAEAALGNQALAEMLLRKSLRLAREYQANDNYTISVAVDHLARVIYDGGYRQEGVKLTRESIENTRKTLPPGHPKITGALATLAAMLAGLQAFEEAHQIAADVVELERQENGQHHPAVANALTVLALTSFRTEKLREAKSQYEEALAICNRNFTNPHPTHIKATRGVAYCLSREGRRFEASAMFHETLKDMRALNYDNTVEFCESLGALGDALTKNGQPLAAMKLLKAAKELLMKMPRPNQNRLTEIREAIKDAESVM